VHRSYEIGIDHQQAVQSRIRQLQAAKDALEVENKRLRARLSAIAEQERRARFDE
jgi:regulator of replication initiation timing